MKRTPIIFAMLLAAQLSLAQGTHTWLQSKFEEFEQGTAKGVAMRSEGRLELAPAFKAITTTPSMYLWSIVADGKGNVYAAAGSPARVYRIAADGKTTIIFEPKELQVQAVLLDPAGGLFAATSPDGKVYRIERAPDAGPAEKLGKAKTKPEQTASAAENKSSGEAKAAAEAGTRSEIEIDPGFKSTVFFDPKTKYIWDLARDAEGRLYVATGDRGEIFRVDKDGASSLFFKSDESHIRVLALDAQGNLIAGSDGSGLVYRISPAGEGFVLYSAPKKEITALAMDSGGNIYAAGVGEKHPGPSGLMAPPVPFPTATPQVMPPSAPGVSVITSVAGMPTLAPAPVAAAGGGSEIYRIAPDGTPRRLWSSREDIVYALAFDRDGALLAGTGNKGRIYAVRMNGEFSDLVKASANQASAFAAAREGGLYVATSNLGKVFLLGAAPEAEGSLESDVFDARIFSRWGRAAVRGVGNFDFYARSGNVDNPDRNWSPWKKVELASDERLGVPAARFVQWKGVLRPGATAPQIESVLINYRPNNVPPVIDEVVVQPGARFPVVPRPPMGSETVMVGGQPPAQPPPRFEAPQPALRDRQSIAVRWSAHDDDDDELIYSLYYRGDGETRWQLLKDRIADKFYSWDASLLPDGGYTVKVMASDAPSHSPEEALSDEKESARFEIDNTPPRIESLNAHVEGEVMKISFRAEDAFSPIRRAEYSIDAGDWQFVEPVGLLSDSRAENYDFGVMLRAPAEAGARKARGGNGNSDGAGQAGPAEHVVAVRVFDRYENMGTAKVVVRGK